METRFRRYRQLLEAKRLELNHKVDGLDEETSPHDPGDIAVANGHKEMLAVFQDVRAHMLHFIERALRRMDEGTYGACLYCEKEIPPKRLDAVPWTPYCIGCQEAFDRGALEAPKPGKL